MRERSVNRPDHAARMNRESFRIGAVQAAPVFLDLKASVHKAVSLIESAGRLGVSVLGFPEGFLPGHPGWVELLPFDSTSQHLAQLLFEQAMEVPGPAVRQLQSACRANAVNVVMGMCERRAGTTGTLFNSQLFISAGGDVVGVHQKYVPTVGERLVHAPGQTGSSCGFDLDIGTVSGLICGENSNPLAQYAAAVAYPVVHIASWPQHFSPNLDMAAVIPMVSRGLAYSLKTHVANSATLVSPEMVNAYGAQFEEFLTAVDARSSIVGPSGDILAIAETGAEQIVHAEVSARDLIVPKFVHDVAGHYNRPELFVHLFGSELRG